MTVVDTIEQSKSSLGWQLLKFGATGALSLAVVLGVTSLGVNLGLGTHLSYAIALLIAILVNFCICRYLIFERTQQSFFRELVQFAVSIGIWRVVEFLGFLLLFDVLHLHYQLAVLLIAILMFGFKFVWCKLVIFTKPGEEAVS